MACQCGCCNGACCCGGVCEVKSCAECAASKGVFLGARTICGDPCDAPKGACCTEDCAVVSECECAAAGGEYHGDGTTCDPSPCCPAPCGPCERCVDGVCVPACGECEQCIDGVCVPQCHPCEQCVLGYCVPTCGSCESCVEGVCVPQCGPCDDCVDGVCGSRCGPCETCVEGVCIPGCGPCEQCVDGVCSPLCDPLTECCVEGVCVPCCQPPCGPCEECVSGSCVSTCGPCETCVNGVCTPNCGPCETCVNGICTPTCSVGECCVSNVCVPCAGACCVEGECSVVASEQDCAGTWLGSGTDCTYDLCPCSGDCGGCQVPEVFGDDYNACTSGAFCYGGNGAGGCETNNVSPSYKYSHGRQAHVLVDLPFLFSSFTYKPGFSQALDAAGCSYFWWRERYFIVNTAFGPVTSYSCEYFREKVVFTLYYIDCTVPSLVKVNAADAGSVSGSQWSIDSGSVVYEAGGLQSDCDWANCAVEPPSAPSLSDLTAVPPVLVCPP